MFLVFYLPDTQARAGQKPPISDMSAEYSLLNRNLQANATNVCVCLRATLFRIRNPCCCLLSIFQALAQEFPILMWDHESQNGHR